MSTKRILFALHRWLGLAAGLFLLAIGTSGSLLVFKTSLDRTLNPALYHIASRGDRLSLDSAFSIIFQKYGPGFQSCSIDLPRSPNDVFEFTLTARERNTYSRPQYLVDMHPVSREILREGYCNTPSTSFIHWLMYFHDSFQGGRIGMLIVALAGAVLFLSMTTGLLFYGKKILDVLLFRVPLRQKSGTQFYRALHLYVAVWALLFNIIVFFTGLWMVRSVFVPSAWTPADAAATSRITISLDSCVAKSREAIPGFIPDYISIPLVEGVPVEIDGNNERSPSILDGDASYVVFDSRRGTIIDILDVTKVPLPKSFAAAFWQMHIGNFGGLPVKILYAVGGLMPGILSLSGYALWWKRKRMYAALQR